MQLQKSLAKVNKWKKDLTPQTKLARRAWCTIGYQHWGTKESKDITEDISKYLLDITYTDNLSGTVDDVSLSLEDRGRLWVGDWYPTKGSLLEVAINTVAWDNLDDKQFTLPVGQFEIDEFEGSSLPDVVKIKGVAVIGTTDLREKKKDESWKSTTLKAIAAEKAKANNLKLVWDTDFDPPLKDASQSAESDLAFLQKLCNDAGFSLKVSTEQLIIFDDYKYEIVKPTVVIRRPGGQYQPIQVKEGEQSPMLVTKALSYSYKSKTREVYRACHVKYTDKDKKSVIEGTFEDPDRKDKTYLAVLEVNTQVKDTAEALRLAKKKLREANKEADTMSLSLPGHPLLMAAITVKMEGFGVFDGNYLITKATHSVGAHYSTSVELRRCLHGY